MIDDFMRELFTPDAFSGSLFPADSLADRFGAAMPGASFADRYGEFDKPSDPRLAGELSRGIIGPSSAEPPPITELSGAARMAGPPQIPMPRPRPDVESMLSGAAPAPTKMAMAPETPMGGPPGTPPPGLMEKLSGLFSPNSAAAAPAPDAAAAKAAMVKKVIASLAGGMAGGDPAFKGGAAMKGLSGGLRAGQASDKEDADTATSAANTAFDRDLKGRQLAEREKTGKAQRDLYGARTNEIKSGKLSTAWNKPASERYKEAQQLIINKNKEIDAADGDDSLATPKAERDAARVRKQAAKDAFKAETYKNMGLNPDGTGIDAVKPGKKVMGDKEGQDAGLYRKPGEKMIGAGTYDDPHMPQTQEDFDEIPPGGYFLNPADGKVMRKRGQQHSALEDDDAMSDAA